MKKDLVVLFIMLSFGLSACSTHIQSDTVNGDVLDDLVDDSYDEEVLEIWDPLEPMNRVFFDFNDGFYKNILTPVGDVYTYVVPREARTALDNLSYEVAMPARVIGSLTQLDIPGAITEIAATLMNCTWGLIAPLWGGEMLGMVKLETDAEDFGQSLGYWGVPRGPYIVWPFFGPSSLRDSLRGVGEFYANPVSYVGNFDVQLSIKSSGSVNGWSLSPDRYGDIVNGAADPYGALKSSYVQNREALEGK